MEETTTLTSQSEQSSTTNGVATNVGATKEEKVRAQKKKSRLKCKIQTNKKKQEKDAYKKACMEKYIKVSFKIGIVYMYY